MVYRPLAPLLPSYDGNSVADTVKRVDVVDGHPIESYYQGFPPPTRDLTVAPPLLSYDRSSVALRVESRNDREKDTRVLEEWRKMPER